MKRLSGKSVFIVIIAFFVVGISYFGSVRQETFGMKEKTLVKHETRRFFDEYLLRKGLFAKKKQIKNQKSIYGAIVPHHLLASFIISHIFELIANQNVETIILLSPNHYDIGNTPVVMGKIGWNTPYGIIKPDIEIINIFAHKDYISIDDEILDNEHGIAGLLPFLAYYKNDIKVVPIALRQNMTKDQLNDLSRSIADISDDKTVVVASVDFSHYLTSAQAQKNDEETQDAMENYNIDKILQMNSDYMDSPQAIVVLLQAMKLDNAKSMDFLYHTNSGKLMNDLYGKTTSYFGVIFTK